MALSVSVLRPRDEQTTVHFLSEKSGGPRGPDRHSTPGDDAPKADARRVRKSRLDAIASTEKISHDRMSWKATEDHVPFDLETTTNAPENSASDISDIFSVRSCSSTELFDWKSFDADEEKRRAIIRDKWGGYGLHLRLWNDENAPVTKIRERDELVLDGVESGGTLTDRMIGACSSFLAPSPENRRYVLNKCDLNGLRLKDITILRYHHYLQYLDLSHNTLSSLAPLGGIPYLVYLNASHNRIKETLRFSTPWFLTHVNLSYNEIERIDDLSAFWSIVRLDLSHNSIETIRGLQNLRYLRYLNLSYNLIETVSNLDDLLSLRELNLEYNCITSFVSAKPESGINTLPNLRTLIMGHNRLSTLEFFRGAYGLRLIDLRYNKIADLLEVSNLKSLVYEVDLRGNPCTKWPNYKDVVLFSMPSVKYVDGCEITVPEKVSAATLFDPPVELLAARTISKLLLLEQLNVPKIDASVTPYDLRCLPLIILSGPSAVKKIALGIHVADKLTERVRYCRSHTTREVSAEEDESKAYHFISREEFNETARRGEFLSIQELLGNSYGFHRSEIAAMRLSNKIGITQMDLNATMQMMNNYENVKPILVMTKSETTHRKWISEKFHVFTWIKDSVENLLALKIGRNIGAAASPETSDSTTQFISNLVDEVIQNLVLPPYGGCAKPRSTVTELVEDSKTFLPKATKTRGQQHTEENKRHIKFKSVSDIRTQIADASPDHSPKSSDLRVILDEYSNIVVVDEETKRRRKKARALYRQSLLKLRSEGVYEDEELTDSLSSEQSVQAFPERRAVDPEELKNTYIEIVLKSRKVYIKQHQNKPGFYCHVIFTDIFDIATKRLVEIIREIHIGESAREPTRIPEIEYLERYVVPRKVRAIVKDLRESLSTAKIQRKTLLRSHGVTSWKDSMPSLMSRDPKDFINSHEEEFKERSKFEL